MVLSFEPDTIVFPSGEKATEEIQSLWAFAFSLFKVRESASATENRTLAQNRARLDFETAHPRL